VPGRFPFRSIALSSVASGILPGRSRMDDVEYYRQRAADEWERSKASDNPKAAEIHENLAKSYEELIELLANDSNTG
jgi:hypothetical protein